ncbi:peptidoglycan bridge formation glycyltransferase FemA/FemB family protein [Thalassobellus sediminis]|uniref:peptidoglycan bridge formation glycyltransferase FemA/FemB family protein n=1 Tax=Thalassobellus sediminis TaxID=3367753 RepID=UPI0037B45AAA
MSYTLNEIRNKIEWTACINKCDSFDFYHTYDYHELSKSDKETPLLLEYTEEDIIIVIPLLVRDIAGTNYRDATSVYGYAGPITKNLPYSFDNSNFKKYILTYFKKNNFVSIFSRLNPFIPGQCRTIINIGTIYNQGKVVNIKINEDVETQRQLFQRRLKTHINKAKRHCSIKKATTDEDLNTFIDIYHENMDRVNAKKTYYFSNSYFKKIVASDAFETIILLATDNNTGTVIAGCQFIITNGIVQYHLSGTKNDFLHFMPTKLLIDEMRIRATKEGFKFFNLGGGLGGNDNDSLFNFKSSFSKDFKDFNLWKLVTNQKVYNELIIKKDVKINSNYFPLYRYYDDLNVDL